MSQRICSIDGCSRALYARGWCSAHYRRWRRRGTTDHIRRGDDPLLGILDDDALNRFFAKVEIGDCWLWVGLLDEDGYGRHAHFWQVHRAHRWLYEYLVGPVPDGLQLDHLCRVRHCVNPDHLEPVTGAGNLRRSGAVRAWRERFPRWRDAA